MRVYEKGEVKVTTGVDVYRSQSKLWKESKLANVGEYLRYYNNLDVLPFVEEIIQRRWC